MAVRRVPLFLFTIASLCLASCAGSLFKVKPVTELPPLPAESRRANAESVSIRVAPLLTDEQSQELFEANLPLSGVLPVRLEMTFQSGAAVDLNKVKFVLRDSQGRVWKWLSSNQAISRILKANGIYAYNPNSRKQFEQDLATYAIDLKTPLSTSDLRRQGFLFFQSPDKRPIVSGQQLTLLVERLPQPVSITLN